MTDNNSIKKYAVALGYFDGLHRAHMAVINKALADRSLNVEAAVLLFDKHPQQVLSGKEIPFVLQKEMRDKILASLEITPYEVSFEEIKDMSPADFVDRLLVDKLHAYSVSCGFNYRFGRKGEGDVNMLKALCAERGIKVHVCPEMKEDDTDISSTEIRKAVESGDILRANLMLGRPFGFISTVIHGDHRGRLLGAPTINQLLPEGIAVPPFGVYAAKVVLDGKEYTGVTNIGSRPTFNGAGFRSETFILGYEGDLYGERIEIKLYNFIRPERKFASADELKSQIMRDAGTALKLLGE